MKKLCACGCGQEITSVNYKGALRTYINHHNPRGAKVKSGRSKYTTSFGFTYHIIFDPEHPLANKNGYLYEHKLLAEKALGKPLPDKAVVHHYTAEQLIICQDQAYHLLLHQRQRAYEACGHANWFKCVYCKKYDAPENLYLYANQGRHKKCTSEYLKQRYKNSLTVKQRFTAKELNKLINLDVE